MVWPEDFFEIDLSKVRVPRIDPNFQRTYHGYTREEVEGWIRNLKEIQRLCRERGYTAKDFQRMRHSLDPKEQALWKTYYELYESPQKPHWVKVSWERDHYEVENGAHRILLAKQMGLKHMPAHVAAPDVATLQRLRAEGERVAAGEYPKRTTTPVWERTPQQRRPVERER